MLGRLLEVEADGGDSVHGVVFVGVRGEDLEEHGLVGQPGDDESFHGLSKLFLVGSAKVLEAQIFGIVLHQGARLVAVVTCRSHIGVGLFLEGEAGMAAELELRSHAVVDEQDAQVTAHVAVTQGIHVVEEGEVARSEEGEALKVDQRGSQRRAIGSVDTTATYVAGRLHALRQGEHVPTATCVGRTEVEQTALGQARRELHSHPHVAEG